MFTSSMKTKLHHLSSPTSSTFVPLVEKVPLHTLRPSRAPKMNLLSEGKRSNECFPLWDGKHIGDTWFKACLVLLFFIPGVMYCFFKQSKQRGFSRTQFLLFYCSINFIYVQICCFYQFGVWERAGRTRLYFRMRHWAEREAPAPAEMVGRTHPRGSRRQRRQRRASPGTTPNCTATARSELYLYAPSCRYTYKLPLFQERKKSLS